MDNGHSDLGSVIDLVRAGQSENRTRFDAIERRVSSLEQAVVKGASKSGAAAGRKWGAVAGGFILGLASMLSNCDAPAAEMGQGTHVFGGNTQ